MPSDDPDNQQDIKPRSRDVTDGLEKTAARGMLRAVGMGDEDFAKPQIGVASSWNEITPCNLSLQRLAQAVKNGVHAAGGYPMEFGTISVSDGISMGHEGMHFSLVSREVIADSVETVMSAERLDGSVLLAGCGMSLPGSAAPPAVDRRRDGYAQRSGEAVVGLIRQGITARQIMTKPAFENAIAVVMALGGSTNAVLHLLAMAREADVDLSLDDFTRVGAKVPHLGDLKPFGRYVMNDVDKIGGIPVVMKLLLDAGLMDGDCLTVTGRTLAENLADLDPPAADDDVIRSLATPIHRTGGDTILHRALAPQG